MFRRRLCELREDLELQIQNLGDCFDHEIHISKGIEGCCRLKTAADGIGIALADFLLSDVLREQFVGKCETFVESGLGCVDEDDRDAGLAGGDEGDSETLWWMY
jgi:hypothetical protein